jgi:predicted RNase H-like nuclease
VLIDIPIGLESKTHRRDLDLYARQHLKPGSSSAIFTPPAREALKAANYKEACDTNMLISGKKISIQSWNISKKILEVDNLITHNESLRSIIHECHPEICFKYLNDNHPLIYSKRAKARLGIEERLNILSKYYGDIHESFQRAASKYSSAELKADDILDSLCLYMVGNLGTRYGFNKITGSTLADEYNIDLNLYYFNPAKIKTEKVSLYSRGY